MKLKVYSGVSLHSECALVDTPAGVVSFYMEQPSTADRPAGGAAGGGAAALQLRRPAVAVAAGSCVFVYKNMKPYYKCSLPAPADVSQSELQLWKKAESGAISPDDLYSAVKVLSEQLGVSNLTNRSLCYLQCSSEGDRQQFVKIHAATPLRHKTVITYITTVYKCQADANAVSCLVIATEHGQVHILDPQAFTILVTVKFAGVPSIVSVTGLFDVEYRMVVACRNGKLFSAKRGVEIGRATAQLPAHIVSMERFDKSLVVACSDQCLYAFTNHGRRLWSLQLSADILCTATLSLSSRAEQLIVVSLASCQLLVFRDRQLVDRIQLDSQPASAVICGRFGREDHVLLYVTKGGGLFGKILRRSAVFNTPLSESDAAATKSGALDATDDENGAQANQLAIPKRSQLFIDQIQHERQNCTALHRSMQYSMCLMRLTTARHYVEALKLSTPSETSPAQPIRFSAQLFGLGPMFRVRVELENLSSSLHLAHDLYILIHADADIYRLEKPLINVPVVVPGVQYVFCSLMEQLNERDHQRFSTPFTNNNSSSANAENPAVESGGVDDGGDVGASVLLMRSCECVPLASVDLVLPSTNIDS